MKKIFIIIAVALVFTSCENEPTTNYDVFSFYTNNKRFDVQSDGYNVLASNVENMFDNDDSTYANFEIEPNGDSAFQHITIRFIYNSSTQKYDKCNINKIYLKCDDSSNLESSCSVINANYFDGNKSNHIKEIYNDSCFLNENTFLDEINCNELDFYFSNNNEKSGCRNIKIYDIKIF